jgi:alkanesulfonate monooxygenase SsuD/methylene tetrahydromethanopterin reductase-like flavin-dependent oxidoreductase (luciferase family)
MMRSGGRATPGGLGGRPGQGAGFDVIAGSPVSVREYVDEYLKTGANYFVCSFQWGSLTHEQAMSSLELFIQEVMPYYTAVINPQR